MNTEREVDLAVLLLCVCAQSAAASVSMNKKCAHSASAFYENSAPVQSEAELRGAFFALCVHFLSPGLKIKTTKDERGLLQFTAESEQCVAFQTFIPSIGLEIILVWM